MTPALRGTSARLALLALARGEPLREAGWSKATIRWLDERRWIHRERGAGVWALATDHAPDLCVLLDQVWPEWRQADAALRAAGLPCAPEGWQRHQDQSRLARFTRAPAPTTLARRTAAAALRGDSKSQAELDREPALSGCTLDDAGAARIRPSHGLRLQLGEHSLDARDVAAVTGELALSERALARGLTLAGTPPRAVLTVENPAAYVDLPDIDGLLIVLLPGVDQRAGLRIVTQLPNVPWAHFGDLDPAGLDLFRRCQRHRADCVWWVPAWWEELLDTHGREGATWPTELGDVPPLVARLAACGLWLEQEPLVLDRRMEEELRAWVVGRLAL